MPQTYTWNGVGLKSFQIFGIDDFIDYEAIIKKIETTSEVKSCLIGLKEDFFKYFQESILKEVKNKNDEISVEKFVDSYRNIGLKLDLSIRFILGKISVSSNEIKSIENNCFNSFIEVKELREGLEKAKEFFQGLKNNTEYEDCVINYGHSKDITFNLYNHIGSSYDVDREFKKSKNKKIVEFVLSKENVFTNYHFDDVFLPYFSIDEKNYGEFEPKINTDYISSLVRHYFYKEEGFSGNILKNFYTLKYEILDPIFIQQEIINGIKKSPVENLYKKQVIERLQEMEAEEILEVWKKTREKMSSPYEFIDIYDGLLY